MNERPLPEIGAAGVAAGGPRGGDLDNAADLALVRRAASGDAASLEALVRLHQDWVYAIALRMTGDPHSAADASQDALVRLVTRIAQFEGRSRFRTWAYRIVVTAVLDAWRRTKRTPHSWTSLEQEITALGESEWTEDAAPPDVEVMHEETRIRCMTGMLMCLDADQRIIYVLCDSLELPVTLAAEILEIAAPTARKRLERARRDLGRFVFEQCGLVNPQNPCRCPKKTRGLVERGLVDPRRLVFTRAGWRRAEQQRPELEHGLSDAEARIGALMRAQPLVDGPDFARKVTQIVGETMPKRRD